MKKLTDEILDAIDIIVEEKIKALPQTKMFKSVIISVNSDKTYTIIKDKQKYDVNNGLGIDLFIGQNVWVIIPNGILRDMFICGIR